MYDRLAMGRRNRARYLAPVALIVAIAGTVAVVQSGLRSHPAPPRARVAERRHRRVVRAHFYIVQPGENLTGISSKTGVGVGAIEAMNPNLDPNTLQAGQRLRLRR